MDDHQQALAILKTSIAWVGVIAGHAISSISLSGIALTVTTIYSALQAYVVLRDKIIRKRP